MPTFFRLATDALIAVNLHDIEEVCGRFFTILNSASLGEYISFNAHFFRRNLKLDTGVDVICVAADFDVDVLVLVGKISEIPASGAGLPTK